MTRLDRLIFTLMVLVMLAALASVAWVLTHPDAMVDPDALELVFPGGVSK